MEGALEINPDRVETLYASGMELPYVQFGGVDPALKLVYAGEEHWYVRTLPLKGYGAVIEQHIRDLETDGKNPILARFWNRIYIYATGVTPIGTGKK
jgi:hypothetical protein